MLVSIITVSYNSEDTIRQTIEAVYGQSWHQIEYIVVDGASSDGTMDIVKEYSEKGISGYKVSADDREN